MTNFYAIFAADLGAKKRPVLIILVRIVKGDKTYKQKKTYESKRKDLNVFFERLTVLDNPSLMIGSVVEFCLGFGCRKKCFLKNFTFLP